MNNNSNNKQQMRYLMNLLGYLYNYAYIQLCSHLIVLNQQKFTNVKYFEYNLCYFFEFCTFFWRIIRANIIY